MEHFTTSWPVFLPQNTPLHHSLPGIGPHMGSTLSRLSVVSAELVPLRIHLACGIVRADMLSW